MDPTKRTMRTRLAVASTDGLTNDDIRELLTAEGLTGTEHAAAFQDISGHLVAMRERPVYRQMYRDRCGITCSGGNSTWTCH